RPVQLLDERGNVLRTFDDAVVASVLLGVSPKSIRDCCNGRTKSSDGKRWRYKPSQSPAVTALPEGEPTSVPSDGTEVEA
ncbi:MAG: hypothetical protein IJW16_00075, partial [Clostridia bacterium]|nr:hypothetical protein [Clostridia bacterium]